MRRRSLMGPALGALLAFGAADVAAAANVDVQAIDGPGGVQNSWSKTQVDVNVGDTVTWKFDGTELPHNVQSSTPNWTFTSPTGAPAQNASFQFTAAGTYAFVCNVHPEMRGVVAVSEPGGTAPPPPPVDTSPQPYPNDSSAPEDLENGGFDTTRPRLSRVRVREAGSGLRVRLRTSESTSVRVRIERRGRTVKQRRFNLRGTRQVTVRNLRDGRYTVVVDARDRAGNPARIVRKRITLR